MMHERLRRLSEVLPPGWYVDRQQLHHRYYVSPPNFRTMKYTYFQYNTSKNVLSTNENDVTALCDFSSVTEDLTELANQFRRMESPDSLLYFEYETVLQKNCFWISRSDKRLTWSTDQLSYPLTNNRCVVASQVDHLEVNFYDREEGPFVLLQCRQEDSSHFSHGAYPSHKIIYPMVFKMGREPPHDTDPSWVVTPQDMIDIHLTPNEYVIVPRDYVTVQSAFIHDFPKDFLKTWWVRYPDLY